MMDFTFVTLIFSAGLFIGSYFFYVQLNSSIDQKCDMMMHHIEDHFCEIRPAMLENYTFLRELFEKNRVEIVKIKDEIDILKEQKKETPKPMRKLPLKSNDKSSEDSKD